MKQSKSVFNPLDYPSILDEPSRLTNIPSWHEYIPFAFWIVAVLKPKTFVELGTHKGDSYSAFCQAVSQLGLPTRCYAVDTWKGDEHAGFYEEDVFTEFKAFHDQQYGQFSQLIRSTFDEALEHFSDGSIDLLHIDGLHTYDAVRHDLDCWLPKMSKKGVILLHDTNVRERGFGVWKLWEELKEEYPSFEFVHGHGLGILMVGKAAPEKLNTLLAARKEVKEKVRKLFYLLGNRVALQRNNNQLQQSLAERDRQVANLNQAVAERDGQIATLHQAAIERDGQIAVLNGVVVQRDALLASTSCRLTAPLRMVGHQLKRAGHIWRVLSRILVIGGGLRESLNKALRVLRDEGLFGVKQRIEYAATGKRPLRRSPTPSNESPTSNSYDEWIRRYDTLTDGARARIKEIIENLASKPVISVVMPVYNPKPQWLQEAIESVRQQIYPNWELCIADDASTDPRVRKLLEQYAREDTRIKIVFRENNGHISAASNSALALASGQFVALLDHDDQLHPLALHYVAEAIAQQPDVGLIFSDEDKVDEKGLRHEPYFKCEFNYELFLAQNMVSHLGIYRRDLVEKLGGFREGFEGSQDYDLTLRAIEHLRVDQIVHVPRVLYHWRVLPGSTAMDVEEKPYAVTAARKALQEHLNRRGIDAKVLPSDVPSMHRVRYTLPASLPSVTIIIPTRDRADLLRVCLESLSRRSTYPNYEVLIIDNGSQEKATFELFRQLSDGRFKVIRDDSPFNFSAMNNRAVSMATGAYVCLMNNDIEIVTPDWLEEMLSFAIQTDVGAVGARLWYPDGRLQHGGVLLGIGGIASHSHKFLPKGEYGYFGRAVLHQSFSAITAACLLIRKSLYTKVGGLDEGLRVSFNDIDFCLRVREAGYRNVWTPYAEMIHHESASRGRESTPEQQARFATEIDLMRRRWGKVLTSDAAYSLNLTLSREDFALAWPPRLRVA